jgi:Protein of unknown function/AsmA-like C-terminal region
LKRRIAKIAAWTVLALLFIVFLGAGIFAWRLSQGPIAISFLNSRIEQAINGQLKDMKVQLGTAVLELDANSHVPHIRFRNLVLSDSAGSAIASAPRAAVTLDSAALWSGRIAARSLELIGPKISARRNVDGTVELGVGGQEASIAETQTNQAMGTDATQGGKSDRDAQASPEIANQTSGAKLIALLDDHSDGSSLSSLEDIRITSASINVYDDANSANWFAPNADLTFRKMPYGFVILAKAEVSTAKDPWHTELSATYKHDQKNFAISATVDNVVPADVADKIFALSQFAQVRIPLAGHIELETTDGGAVTAASAEFTAGKGRLSLPDFVAQPIDIDNGTLNVKYRPDQSSFDIIDSSLVVGGTRADLSGNVAPVRAADGKLTAIKIQLKAHNVSLDATGTKTDPIVVDRVEFAGQAGITDASLTIEDFVVMSGNSGVRMRGSISSGEKSPAIHLAGRVRDISAEFLKTIWPPIIAPNSRKWIAENVIEGRVSEGTFQVNLNANALAKAQLDKRLPENSVDFSFKIKDVSTHYLKNMPILTKGEGEGGQHDNDFELNISAGQTSLDSGQTVKLNSGSFIAKNVMLAEVPGIFAFDLSASIDAMLAFASQPDLDVIKTKINEFGKLQGKAEATIGLKLPLIDNVPKDRIDFSTDVKLIDVSLPAIVPGVDLSDGQFNVDIFPDSISIAGPAKINGLPAEIKWQKPRTGGQSKATVSATLDEKTREKIGLKLSDYISGPLPVKATIDKNDAGDTEVAIDADLSQIKMKLAAISWKREAKEGTKASFILRSNAEGRNIDNFVLDGEGLHLRGNIKTTLKGKLQSVVMDQIKLDEDNVFSASIVPGEGTVDLTLSGKNFDARPYIKTLVAPAAPVQGKTAPSTAEGQDFTMRAHFDRVTANRGEIISNVDAVLRARASKIAEADIKGTFLNGQTLNVSVVPLATGREFRISSNDGGSVLRAANFYSKIAGGQLRFYALLGNEEGSPVHNGNLDILNFDVRNEAALAELDQRGKPKKSGPRKEGINFERLHLPFTTDDRFIRLGNVVLKGSNICATADGVIRKSDNAIDVTGTMIPACGLSGVFNNVPLLGDILSGGNSNEGLFGVTYLVGGTFAKPEFKVNPISAIAPGIFRRFFDFSPKRSPAQGTN